jgi:hypothetical protein
MESYSKCAVILNVFQKVKFPVIVRVSKNVLEDNSPIVSYTSVHLMKRVIKSLSFRQSFQRLLGRESGSFWGKVLVVY